MSHSPYQVMDGDPTPHPKNRPALLIHSSSSFLQSVSTCFLLNTISSLHCFFFFFFFQFSDVATMAIIHKEILFKSFYILAPCFEQCVETFFRIKENWWLFKKGGVFQRLFISGKTNLQMTKIRQKKKKTLPLGITSWLEKLTPFPKVQRIGNDHLPIITRLWIRMVWIRILSKIYLCVMIWVDKLKSCIVVHEVSSDKSSTVRLRSITRFFLWFEHRTRNLEWKRRKDDYIPCVRRRVGWEDRYRLIAP